MATSIQWTDETWNPVVGCERISPGCAHCYAKTLHDKRHTAVLAGKKLAPQYAEPFETVQLKGERLNAPLRWREPRMVFVNSVSDLFHEDVPASYIAKVFSVMAQARRHTFQVLTKRAARMLEIVPTLAATHTAPDGSGWPLPNVWLGVSVENQHFADERIPLLLQTPAAVRFISAEPLLEPVILNLKEIALAADHEAIAGSIDWVIVGGESGPGARPFDARWARLIVKECRSYGAACFVKQLGAKVLDRNDAGYEGDTPTSWPMDTDTEDNPRGYREEYQGAPVRVRLVDRKGGDPSEWPEDLRVRQFPTSPQKERQ
jgi:protein gp37